MFYNQISCLSNNLAENINISPFFPWIELKIYITTSRPQRSINFYKSITRIAKCLDSLAIIGN